MRYNFKLFKKVLGVGRRCKSTHVHSTHVHSTHVHSTQYTCTQYTCTQYTCTQYTCTQYTCILYNTDVQYTTTRPVVEMCMRALSESLLFNLTISILIVAHLASYKFNILSTMNVIFKTKK